MDIVRAACRAAYMTKSRYGENRRMALRLYTINDSSTPRLPPTRSSVSSVDLAARNQTCMLMPRERERERDCVGAHPIGNFSEFANHKQL